MVASTGRSCTYRPWPAPLHELMAQDVHDRVRGYYRFRELTAPSPRPVADRCQSLFGYDQGLMSGIIASRQFNGEFPQTRSSGPDDVHGGTIQGTVTAIYEVGCFFGAMFAYFFGERLGRRHMMLGGAYVMIIGTVIQVTAFGHSKGFLQFMMCVASDAASAVRC
jgi:hypothetical protein